MNVSSLSNVFDSDLDLVCDPKWNLELLKSDWISSEFDLIIIRVFLIERMTM